MMNPVFALAANGMSWGERISTSLIVTLQGMLTIFLVLVILWGAIEIVHHVVHKDEKVPKEKAVKQAPVAPAEDDKPVATAIAATMAANDDGALVAAITAAVSAALAEDGYTGAFRVVSFKRVGTATRKKI